MESIQPKGKNFKAVTAGEAEAIRAASLSPFVAYPSSSQKAGVKSSVPYHFLKDDLPQALQNIREISGVEGCDRTIQKFMDPTVREDKRIFTGLCIIHQGASFQWAGLQEGIQRWRDDGSCQCASCRGVHKATSLSDMLRACVCKPRFAESLSISVNDVYQPIRYVPNYNCVVGDCQACGWHLVQPGCPNLRESDLEVTHNVFTRVDMPTKGGKVFRKTMSVPQPITMRNLCINLKEGHHTLLEHHYQNIWISHTTELLFGQPPLGWVCIRWDFPMKYELKSKASTGPEFYVKPKMLALIATVHCNLDGKPESHGLFFLTCGSMSKCQSYIQHCIGLALHWVRRRGGVTRVVHSSDRARQEFSNGTNLLHLSRHVDNYGVPGEWVFSTPNEGKGPNDALGFAVTKILHERVARGARCPDYVAAAAILRKHTQGKPIRGKYSVYQQYVFMSVDPSDVINVDPGKTVPMITKAFHFRSLESGELEKRRLPCWCDLCVAGDRNPPCLYTSWASEWDKVPKPGVKTSGSQLSQDSSFESGSDYASEGSEF